MHMQDSNLQEVLFVPHNLYIHHILSDSAKRTKRKLRRKHLSQAFTYKQYSEFDKDALRLLEDFVKSARKRGNIGFLSDDNVVLDNLVAVPPAPREWDVLFLQSDIDTYDFSDANNTIYWCSTKVDDSRNFVINGESIDKVVRIIRNSRSWKELIHAINTTLRGYSITQYMLSEKIQKGEMQLERKLRNNFQELIKLYDERVSQLNDEQRYKMLPKVSLICVIKSKERFFHVINTFLRINYPQDKIELVIVDDRDITKLLKGIMPNDSRIKIIDITDKNNSQDSRLSLGYKINMGVKYASHNVISHFFDTNCYFQQNFKNIVKYYVLSGKPALLSIDSGIYEGKSCFVANEPDVANMMYNKMFWKVGSFPNLDKSSDLLYKMLYYRTNCVTFVPFVHMSFSAWESPVSRHQLDFDLVSLLTDDVRKSFEIVQDESY